MENNTQELDPTVQKALEAVAEYQGKKTSGKKGWIAGLAAGILTLVALGLLFWKLFQNGRKHAKIEHERDMLVEKEKQARVDAEISDNVEEIERLKVVAEEALEDATDKRRELLQIRAEARVTDEVIKSLQTWDDVDKYLAGKK